MRRVRTALLQVLALPGFARAFTPLLRDRATVFVLHRLNDPERGIPGNRADAIRAALAYLRRERFELVHLEEVVRRSQNGDPPLRGAVAFTLDDGYAEQGVPMASIFAEFDCPSTTFVTTGFLDGDLWMWWDRIEYVLRRTRRRRIEAQLGGRDLVLEWEDDAARDREQARFIAACKQVPDAEKHRGIVGLASGAEVELPKAPPPEYAPMSWSDLRASEELGMQFGPHTVSHPILTRATDEQVKQELAVSWGRLREEAAAPVPIFCYPNGQLEDFGSREVGVMRELGFRAAVTGFPGYVGPVAAADASESFELRRFALSDRLSTVAQYASGFELLKEWFRRPAPPTRAASA